MAQIFSPELRAGGKSFPIEVNGEKLVFYCDFQWNSENFLCQPFFVIRGRLQPGRAIRDFRYNINGEGNNYLEFPDFYFSLGTYAYMGRLDYLMFPRCRKNSAVICARFKVEPYLMANNKAIMRVYKITGNAGNALDLVECPFSRFDEQYKFDTLPTADDGTFWGVRYDKAFYGGIKLIS